MRSKKAHAAIAAALALGIATSYMVYSYLDRARQEARPVPTTKVVTAVKDIPARTVITKSMVHLVDVPLSAKLPLAVATLEQADGKVTKLPVSQGEQLLPNKLFADREQSGLAFVIPPGKRAVAVAVNEVVGSGGLIEPGDSVDVLAVIDSAANGKGADQAANDKQQVKLSWEQQPDLTAVAQYILQNVQVLAVAQNLEGDLPGDTTPKASSSAPLKPGAQAPAKPNAKANAAAHTATLAVDPEQAERLVLAEDKGRIRLVVRSNGDDRTMNIQDGLFVGGGDGMLGLKAGPRPQ